jgi:glutamine---fructose-6-phosphate transaminase (isomerizing)
MPAIFNFLLIKIYQLNKFFNYSVSFLRNNIYFGKNPNHIPDGSIVFFPYGMNTLSCGLVGIVALKSKEQSQNPIHVTILDQMVEKIISGSFELCRQNSLSLSKHYLGGEDHMDQLLATVRAWKVSNSFYQIYINTDIQNKISYTASRLAKIIDREKNFLIEQMGYLGSTDVEIMVERIEKAKDVAWVLQWEILGNIDKVRKLMSNHENDPGAGRLKIYKMINAVLNSLDRLEVRGRDSAGISLMFILNTADYEKFHTALSDIKNDNSPADQFHMRIGKDVLLNRDISIRETTSNQPNLPQTGLTFTYKVAAEIGSLGDNITFLRNEITTDSILHLLTTFPHLHHTVSAHTRWASVGAITEANCHPVDNKCVVTSTQDAGIIHASLNGDIDNYHELKAEYERNGGNIHEDITTDTKIIPIQIEKYIRLGYDIYEAFRMAVNDFKGSHAISIHTDLVPGKILLAQRGSGQAVFIGVSEDQYMPASEIYGFVEETQAYIKLDGEKTIKGKKFRDHGQIFVIDSDSKGGIDGVRVMCYDGTPINLTSDDIKYTEITSRDIDRQHFPHYFLKEISEAPDSVEKTLMNRWKISDENYTDYKVVLGERVFPEDLKSAFVENRIKRIFVVGQGTAGIAATACGDIIDHYLDDPTIQIRSMKASELSGFKLPASQGKTMTDTLVIAISQSGTTADTNRTVDMVRERGAKTIAIVNRRDSDITFKVDGVMYTSNGRDLEMSVASTKAFYSQIVAGAILGLFMAGLKNRRSPEFIDKEIRQLLEIPGHMRKVLSLKDKIEESAKRLAVTKNYWAVVGSGPNKASSDEIRIKLSELCYKTISTDCVEDKKHIDLSSEPLILVCAAGTGESVIGDLIKDTAIFKAHKASPVVIANEGENRFEGNAEDVFHVPVVCEHLAPILNTLVGHLWGYYAALSINDVSKFLDGFRENIQKTIENFSEKGMDLYEVILEKSFREKIGKFNREFRIQMAENRFPAGMGLKAASDLSLLLKYFSGRLPLTDFEIDFGVKGTPVNMINQFYECIGNAINAMTRPIDAIKHQAKTVTVGTSRLTEKTETGILFDALAADKFTLAQLTPNNILVLRNVQEIISTIKGSILYRINGLDLLGEVTDNTTIDIIKKDGVLQPIPSRVEHDKRLKGSKRIIVQGKNIYIGKGRKDNRSIVVIPITSSSHAKTNVIEYLFLLNVSFKDHVPLTSKIKALGGKYEKIKNIVLENSVPWQDNFIELVEIKELFGSSAEKIGEYIVSHQKLAGFKLN